jgi:hypothetical protein
VGLRRCVNPVARKGAGTQTPIVASSFEHRCEFRYSEVIVIFNLTFQNTSTTSPDSGADAPFSRQFQETLMIDPTEAAGWISAGKSGLDLLRAAWTLMPKGAEKDRIASKARRGRSSADEACN